MSQPCVRCSARAKAARGSPMRRVRREATRWAKWSCSCRSTSAAQCRSAAAALRRSSCATGLRLSNSWQRGRPSTSATKAPQRASESCGQREQEVRSRGGSEHQARTVAAAPRQSKAVPSRRSARPASRSRAHALRRAEGSRCVYVCVYRRCAPVYKLSFVLTRRHMYRRATTLRRTSLPLLCFALHCSLLVHVALGLAGMPNAYLLCARWQDGWECYPPRA